MAQPNDSTEPRIDRDRPEEESTKLREELDRSRAEVLRLRDLLLVKEAELGAVRGQLAELENISRGLMMAAGRVQRRFPGLMRIFFGVARRVRRLARPER